jgi:putative N6-adenine-specific DNA methylase
MLDDAIIPENAMNGSVHIQFSIVSDVVTFMIDTSGDGLHKRGYRPLRHEAPIRETLAAAMISLSLYHPQSDEVLFDPFCGSGTIPIEAAMIATRMAPGRTRRFAGENWPLVGKAVFDRAREEAMDLYQPISVNSPLVFGTDIESSSIVTAKENAARAGVADLIRFDRADAMDLTAVRMKQMTGRERFLMIGNPPYGERMLDQQQADELIVGIGRTFFDHGRARGDLRLSIISPEDRFERLVGGQADKRRKLYNGMIKCTMYHYFRHYYDKRSEQT